MPPESLYLRKVQRKLEDNSVCIPQAGKPKLFQRFWEDKEEKVGISLTGAPGPGLTLWDEVEGLIALALGHTQLPAAGSDLATHMHSARK